MIEDAYAADHKMPVPAVTARRLPCNQGKRTGYGTLWAVNRLRVLTGAIAVAVSVVSLNACSGSNPGGNTSCGSYRALSTSDRLAAVKAMIDQRHGDDTPAKVDTTELSVDAYCFTHPSDNRISDIYSG